MEVVMARHAIVVARFGACIIPQQYLQFDANAQSGAKPSTTTTNVGG